MFKFSSGRGLLLVILALFPACPSIQGATEVAIPSFSKVVSASSGGSDSRIAQQPEPPLSTNISAAPAISSCPRAVVTSGLGLSWQENCHRISVWELAPQQETCPSSVPSGVPLFAGYVGGSWSTGETATDWPMVQYLYSAVQGGTNVGFYPAEFELFIDPPTYQASGELVVPLDLTGLSGFSTRIATIPGLYLRTDVPQTDPDYPRQYDPALGYTNSGIGVELGNVVQASDGLHIPVWVRFELGGLWDRPGMNRAIPHARTKAVVKMLLIGLKSGAITPISHAYVMEYDPPSFTEQDPYPHAPAWMRVVSAFGKPGYTNAFVALQSFNFQLYGPADRGDYVRELSVIARLSDYNSSTGETVVDLDGYASNVGLFTFKTMKNEFAARLALVQLPDGTVTKGELKATFDTGETTLVLP